MANLKQHGLFKIFEERLPVYTKYADVIIDTDDQPVNLIIDEIIDSYTNLKR